MARDSSNEIFSSLPESERELRLLAERLAFGPHEALSRAETGARTYLRDTAIRTRYVSGFVLALSRSDPPWFLHVSFEYDQVRSVLCLVRPTDDRGRGSYRPTASRRNTDSEWETHVCGVVQRFLESRGLVRWAREENWLAE
jgi:hypothetical protein